ncbi:aquaporin [Sporolactobacillus shoreicorticis]|uniref:Aquaporin n=1 Tax=Sporolactobacillus shoreicorticis TaxID=1923877 RepID=A0ABW5S140_9BACL|nr:aquaporin [Sporolactobacillus shoreicorticis]MCO7124517.1 aquaporin [Sporolactobacillus shoreicorticis]
MAPGLMGLAIGILIFAIGLSLGRTTGYTINPTRELGLRLDYRHRSDPRRYLRSCRLRSSFSLSKRLIILEGVQKVREKGNVDLSLRTCTSCA